MQKKKRELITPKNFRSPVYIATKGNEERYRDQLVHTKQRKLGSYLRWNNRKLAEAKNQERGRSQKSRRIIKAQKTKIKKPKIKQKTKSAEDKKQRSQKSKQKTNEPKRRNDEEKLSQKFATGIRYFAEINKWHELVRFMVAPMYLP